MVFNSRNMLQNLFHDIKNSSQHHFLLKFIPTVFYPYRFIKFKIFESTEIDVRLPKNYNPEMMKNDVSQRELLCKGWLYNEKCGWSEGCESKPFTHLSASPRATKLTKCSAHAGWNNRQQHLPLLWKNRSIPVRWAMSPDSADTLSCVIERDCTELPNALSHIPIKIQTDEVIHKDRVDT